MVSSDATKIYQVFANDCIGVSSLKSKSRLFVKFWGVCRIVFVREKITLLSKKRVEITRLSHVGVPLKRVKQLKHD